jgi:hypothetical protein
MAVADLSVTPQRSQVEMLQNFFLRYLQSVEIS